MHTTPQAHTQADQDGTGKHTKKKDDTLVVMVMVMMTTAGVEMTVIVVILHIIVRVLIRHIAIHSRWSMRTVVWTRAMVSPAIVVAIAITGWPTTLVMAMALLWGHGDDWR
jgi:hypothetical protein